MNKHQIKGKLTQAKGRVKRAWGEIIGDKQIKAEGSADKLAGSVEEKVGDAQAVVNKGLDKAKSKSKSI